MDIVLIPIDNSAKTIIPVGTSANNLASVNNTAKNEYNNTGK